MNYNKIFVPSTGLDPIKFVSIVAFAKYCKNDLCKLVIDGFRNAGKVAEYVRKHMLASYCFGENWTKYGYSDHNNYFLLSRKDAAVVAKMIADKKATRRPYNPEREKAAWARRLAKLTDITEDEALEIAEAKLEYKQERIAEMEERQDEHYSVCRESLIKKMRRENPLRRIQDAEHAYAILAASHRHSCTDYEEQLEEARELANLGIIDRGDVKEYARQHTHHCDF